MPKPTPKRKRGGQPGNKNATEHGAPPGNRNAYKHGLYSQAEFLALREAARRRTTGTEEQFNEWFWRHVEKLGYSREEVQRYGGQVLLIGKNNPDGSFEPTKIKVYDGGVVVFDSSKCDR